MFCSPLIDFRRKLFIYLDDWESWRSSEIQITTTYSNNDSNTSAPTATSLKTYQTLALLCLEVTLSHLTQNCRLSFGLLLSKCGEEISTICCLQPALFLLFIFQRTITTSVNSKRSILRSSRP